MFIGPSQALGLVGKGLLGPGCAVYHGIPGLFASFNSADIGQLRGGLHASDFFQQAA